MKILTEKLHNQKLSTTQNSTAAILPYPPIPSWDEITYYNLIQETKKKEIRKKKLDAVVSRCCCKRLARKLHPYFWLLSFLDQYFDGSFTQRVLPAVCYMGLGLFFFSPFFLVWQFSLKSRSSFKNPTIYNIIRWFAGLLGQMTRWPSVWCSKHYFFYDFSKLDGSFLQGVLKSLQNKKGLKIF